MIDKPTNDTSQNNSTTVNTPTNITLTEGPGSSTKNFTLSSIENAFLEQEEETSNTMSL